jgi:hypothetical protein
MSVSAFYKGQKEIDFDRRCRAKIGVALEEFAEEGRRQPHNDSFVSPTRLLFRKHDVGGFRHSSRLSPSAHTVPPSSTIVCPVMKAAPAAR